MKSLKPGVTAIQLRLHPVSDHLASVWKNISTVLVFVVMVGGWKYKESDGSLEEKPQLLSIKVVPSPSVIFTWSQI